MIKEIQDLDLERFSEKIDKSLLKLNADGSYDYNGDLNFSYMGLKSLEEIPIRLRNVTGNFYCSSNQFTSLQYAPKEVGSDFDCSHNQLISLEGAPKEVGGSFWCDQNQLTSLRYAPSSVSGNFNCSSNHLTSLQYAPLEVSWHFSCFSNCLLSKAHLSKIDGIFDFDSNPFEITNEVINTIKEMTIDQRVAELKFFEENDSYAYEMMIQILNDNDIGYGPKAKEMLEHTKSLDISNLV